MWNHQDPAGTETRFRAALETASSDEALILQTQIARTYGIREQFDQARAFAGLLEPDLGRASAQANVRFWIEWGRTFCSATHNKDSQTDAARSTARDAFLKAFALARDAQLDGLAIDALHMT